MRWDRLGMTQGQGHAGGACAERSLGRGEDGAGKEGRGSAGTETELVQRVV